MSEMHADLEAAQQRILALKHNLLDLEEAGKRTAERLIQVERRLSDANGEVLRLGLQLKHHLQLQAERDALAARLAGLEGQEPVAVVCDTYELRWIGCGPIAPIISRHQIKVGDSLYARPVPAEESFITVTTDDTGRCVMVSRQDEDHRILSVIWEADGKAAEQPVNARLLAAARAVVARWETPLWKDAPATAGFIYELRDALAESALKAVRLTDEEVASLLADSDKNSLRVPSFFMVEPHKFARAIESAVLAKNGIEVAE